MGEREDNGKRMRAEGESGELGETDVCREMETNRCREEVKSWR